MSNETRTTSIEQLLTESGETPVIPGDQTVPLGCEGEDHAARQRRIELLRTVEAPENASLTIELQGEEITALWRVLRRLNEMVNELSSVAPLEALGLTSEAVEALMDRKAAVVPLTITQAMTDELCCETAAIELQPDWAKAINAGRLDKPVENK